MNQDQIYKHVYEYHRGFAWRRYLARMLDLGFYSLGIIIVFFVIGFLSTLVGDETGYVIQFTTNIGEFFLKFPVADKLFTWFLTCSIFIPISYHFFGSTLGKKIWGISVTNIDGNNLTFKDAYRREYRVFFCGLLFSPLSLIYQYYVLKKNNIVSWDKELNLIVSYKKLNFKDVAVRLLLSIIIFVLYILTIFGMLTLE